MKGSIKKAGLVALVGTIIGVGVYGSKKKEPASPPVAKQPTKQLEEKIKSYKDCKIVFAYRRVGDRVNSEIYIMNPDGSGLEKLTDNGLRNVGPLWSPDGKKIGFSSYREGTGPSSVTACWNQPLIVINVIKLYQYHEVVPELED